MIDVEKLQELRSLRDEGILTEEEFSAAKAQLLAAPEPAPEAPPLPTAAETREPESPSPAPDDGEYVYHDGKHVRVTNKVVEMAQFKVPIGQIREATVYCTRNDPQVMNAKATCLVLALVVLYFTFDGFDGDVGHWLGLLGGLVLMIPVFIKPFYSAHIIETQGGRWRRARGTQDKTHAEHVVAAIHAAMTERKEPAARKTIRYEWETEVRLREEEMLEA